MSTVQEFDFSVNLLRAILWEYQEAESLQSLLQQKQDWYTENQTQFWQDWYRDVFNLQTANDFGLTVWSIILNQKIHVSVNFTPATDEAFGFGQYRMNFTRGNFRSTTGGAYRLPTEVARIVLQLRYFQLIGTSTVPSINRALAWVFRNYGLAYVEDNNDMSQTYFFNFEMNPILLDVS